MNFNEVVKNFPDYQVQGVVRSDFQPYESNGGSIVAIAGKDFAVIAADTRLSSGYNIHSRSQSKLFELSSKSVLASTGCWCDTLALTAIIKMRMQMYQHTHLKIMSTNALAQMLSIAMYNRRFFPYLVSNVMAGIDKDGKGCVFSYDPVGHCERSNFRAGGTSGALLQPVLDCQIGYANQKFDGKTLPTLTIERAIKVVSDAFISAAERDIFTGDFVEIKIINQFGVVNQKLELRKD